MTTQAFRFAQCPQQLGWHWCFKTLVPFSSHVPWTWMAPYLYSWRSQMSLLVVFFFSPLHLVNYVLTQPGTQAFRAWIMHTTWLLHVSVQISECTKEEYSSRMSSERVLSSLHANKQKPQVPGEGRVIDLWERLRLVRIGWESSSSIQEQW